MSRNPAEILDDMSDTYRERNKIYGDNYKKAGKVMEVLFPQGVKLERADQFLKLHLLEMIVMKLTRFTNSNLTHKDSIHDLAVYAAMLEGELDV